MYERELENFTGIPRGAVAKFRHEQMINGVDFTTGKDGAIKFLPEGIEMLEFQFKVTIPAEPKKRAPREVAILIVAVITKNRHIILAVRRMYDSEKLRVEVRSSEGFKSGQEIACEHVEQDLWRYTGRYTKK